MRTIGVLVALGASCGLVSLRSGQQDPLLPMSAGGLLGSVIESGMVII